MTIDDDLVDLYVSQASDWITQHTGREFYDTVGTLKVRYREPYIATSRLLLFIDKDVLGVDSVVNGDGSTLTSSEYWLLPANDTPYYGIEIRPHTGKAWKNTTEDYPYIEIRGTLGYCTAANRPAAVTLAATKLAAHLYMTRDNDGSVIQLADGTSNIPSDMPNIVLKLLRSGGFVRDVMSG